MAVQRFVGDGSFLAFESDDVRTQRSCFLNDESDAVWTPLVTVRYRRVVA